MQLNMIDQRKGNVPIHQIDLSLPPSSRYVALAELYQEQLRELMPLFNLFLKDSGVPPSLFSLIHRIASLILRRLCSFEECSELQGISRVAKVPMYLLISFNVVLDLLMGCTSGAALSLEKGKPFDRPKMLHFRTLDWGMDSLRQVVVQLEFVKTASTTPERVLARSLTYVGFVGVLTGVRPGLSLSLNYRPQHNALTRMDNIRFYAHNLLVLLGIRQSISSLLRNCLFSNSPNDSEMPVSLDHLAETLPSKKSTAAYLIFSDGQSAMTIEKDRVSGKVRRSYSFIVMTNHDLDPSPAMAQAKNSKDLSALNSIIDESMDRRACMLEKWTRKVQKGQARSVTRAKRFSVSSASSTGTETRPTTRNSTQVRMAAGKAGSQNPSNDSTELPRLEVQGDNTEGRVTVTRTELQRWLTAWPTTNECTHFGAILDPTEGEFLWVRRYLAPVDAPSNIQPRIELASALHDSWDL
jgi:beta subunit of N-acylethanolamine-hydrolyzing acid amidase